MARPAEQVKVSAKAGFTLVELLVVIAIISIITGIILAAFSAASERSRQTACLSNLRQLALAAHQYAQDYDGYLPPYNSAFGGSWHTNAGTFPILDHSGQLISSLNPYTRNHEIWFCPSDTFAHTSSTSGVINVNHSFTSYATSIDWWTVVSEHPVLGQMSIDADAGARQLFTDDLWPHIPGATGFQPPYSHNGNFNSVMFDGHAVSLRW